MRAPDHRPRRLRQSLRQWLRSKVTIPCVRWTVSWWLLLVAGALFALAAVGGVAATNRSVFCNSCHEMDVHYSTWRVSSHKDVQCEECHIMPGVGNMVKSKMAAMRQVYQHVKGGVNPSAIQGHVPDESCKKCHPETRDLIVYHSLKITHKKHWDRGIGCTVCHDRVVHGPNAATKNTPKMATCFRCHDGKRAPNTCGLCHETLGVRKPSVFTPEWVEGHKAEVGGDRASCQRCHQEDFCNNCHRMATPHQSTWLDNHPQEFRKSKQDCSVCHADSFCKDCHSIKTEHKLGWLTKHPSEFRRDPQQCDRCHDRLFCSDCHERYQAHPQGWLQLHPGQAKQKPETCKTCHKENFCVGCHQGQVPAGHQDATWLRTHGGQVATSASCRTCHTQSFCLKCHQNQKPSSHDSRWRKLHPIQAKASSEACKTCHTPESCRKCHGTQMPHASNWDMGHRVAAKKDQALCRRCHDDSFCKSCHLSSRPKSHTTGWVRKHGQPAKDPSTCLNCHSKDFCQSCHSSFEPLSHDADWKKAHGKVANKSVDACRTCHSPDNCKKCHGGVDMPHAENWIMVHKNKGASLADGSVCFKCHEKTYCQTCHQ